LGLYLAFKLIGAALRLLMWLVVLTAGYWFVAPLAGWPSLSGVVYVFGPDFEGQRIEEVFAPERLADGIGGRVVDGVVERLPLPEPSGPLECGEQPDPGEAAGEPPSDSSP